VSTLALAHQFVDTVLAADPTPIPTPAPGQDANLLDTTMVVPPGGAKYKVLLGVGLFFAGIALAALTMFFGVKFAASFAEGHGTLMQKFGLAACAVGAIMVSSAGAWVTMFMNG